MHPKPRSSSLRLDNFMEPAAGESVFGRGAVYLCAMQVARMPRRDGAKPSQIKLIFRPPMSVDRRQTARGGLNSFSKLSCLLAEPIYAAG
jgi:hypothetical protein